MSLQMYPDARYLMNLAGLAGQIIRQNFSSGMSFEWKSDSTPVTETDLSISRLVLGKLGRDFPHVYAEGEESNNGLPGAEFIVRFDELDGTLVFCHGLPISSFCISVMRDQTPLSAVIYDPFMDRCWSAEKGKGSFQEKLATTPYSGRQVMAVSKKADLSDSMLAVLWWKGAPYHLGAVCHELMLCGAQWMNSASIAYVGALVGTGDFDATIFPGNALRETAAIQLIVEEAGGKVTDIHGNPVKYGPGEKLKGHIASNGLLHDALVDIVGRVQLAEHILSVLTAHS